MNINLTETLAAMGHEQLIFCHDAAARFHGLIAIHSTKLGPAVGGTRLWSYLNEEQAIVDALRLSRGIIYVPDYVANAGGVINGCREMLGWESAVALQRINGIYDTALTVLQMAATEDLATNQAADRLAEKRLLS